MSTSGVIAIVAVVAFAVWSIAAVLTAEYAGRHGFAYWPTFWSTMFLGFPIVLLAITVGAGVRDAVRESTFAVDRLGDDLEQDRSVS